MILNILAAHLSDLDSLTYALSGLSNQTVGWGQKDGSWQCLDALGRLRGEDWFRLGDRDLAASCSQNGCAQGKI